MGKIRVHELAKELKVSSKELLVALEKMQVAAKNHMSMIDDATAVKIRTTVAAQKDTAKPDARPQQQAKQIDRPAATPKTRPASKPAERAAARSAVKSAPKPGNVPAAKPTPKPGSASAAKPGSAPAKGSANGKKSAAKGRKRGGGNTRQARRPNRFERQNSVSAPAEQKDVVVRIDADLNLKELAQMLSINPAAIIKKLMLQGLMVNINQEVDAETGRKIARDFGFQVEETKPGPESEEMARGEKLQVIDSEKGEDPEDLQARPPVVTVMGHVDHGKTSLLDAIRQTKVTANEAGGITQHIGAYQVELDDRKIVFIDTPGHEAFTAMRARGAQATDIAILVVAADDGIMPQTVEAISHAKAAQVPIIVAINKIDRPNANIDRVKQQLTEHQLVPEDWGGNTVVVPVSAIQRIGIDELLEMILLVAEMQELKANPDRPAKGIIIEAELDKGRGPVATVLIKSGTLRVGDGIIAGLTTGKVRAMIDERGKTLRQAGPSTPIAVLGLSDVPQAGDLLYAVADEKTARQNVESQLTEQREEDLKRTRKVTLDNLFTRIKEGTVKELNIILKADVHGSVEAVRQSLDKLSNASVLINIIHGGVGTITESDVMLATVSNAIIIGFNVLPDTNARRMAEQENIDIRSYRIIYEAIDDIKAAMAGLLEPEFQEVVLGRAEVRALFKVPKAGTIAGCYVQDGKILRNAQIRVIRNGSIVHEGKIESLKRFKDDVREVAAGFECGLGLERYNDVKEGDIVEAFTLEEKS
ncbi:MAG: translation initiation factor IF-2 [bacterium]|jgi:translation initiation factor IF-2